MRLTRFQLGVAYSRPLAGSKVGRRWRGQGTILASCGSEYTKLKICRPTGSVDKEADVALRSPPDVQADGEIWRLWKPSCGFPPSFCWIDKEMACSWPAMKLGTWRAHPFEG